MPWHWTNKLQARLHLQTCQLVRWDAGWSRHASACAEGAGTGSLALRDALSTLAQIDARGLPERLELVVADEYVHHCLVTADTSLQAHAQAFQALGDTFGATHWHLELMPLPSSATHHETRWLIAAISLDDLTHWHREAARFGLETAHLRSALMADLGSRLQGSTPAAGHAVAAWVREQGMSLVRLRHGVPVDVTWEHVDPGDELALRRRLLAFVERTGGGQPHTVTLEGPSRAHCEFRWQPPPPRVAGGAKKTRPEAGCEKPEQPLRDRSVRGNLSMRAAL